MKSLAVTDETHAELMKLKYEWGCKSMEDLLSRLVAGEEVEVDEPSPLQKGVYGQKKGKTR